MLNDLMSADSSSQGNSLFGTNALQQLDPKMKQLLLLKYLQQMFGNQQAPQLAMPGQKQPAATTGQPSLDPMNLLRLSQLMGGGNNMLMNANAG